MSKSLQLKSKKILCPLDSNPEIKAFRNEIPPPVGPLKVLKVTAIFI
jgi:hypothetical protein